MRYIVNSFEFKKRFLDKFIQFVKQLDFEKNYRVDIKWGGLDSSTDVCDVYYKEQKIFTVSKYMSQNITIKMPDEQDVCFLDSILETDQELYNASLHIWHRLVDVYHKQQLPILKQERLRQQREQHAEQSRIKQEQDRILNKIDGFIKMANVQSK